MHIDLCHRLIMQRLVHSSVCMCPLAPMEGLRNQRIAKAHSPQSRRQELYTHGQGILGGLF